ncbi:MAG: hypothetical protein ACRCTZ_09270 [Sarcina sp.]
MKVYRDENIYKEAFTQNIISISNIAESVDVYFSSNSFRNLMNSKVMQTKIVYHDSKDILVNKVNTYCNIPILDRNSEKVLTNFYMPIEYVEVYKSSKLIKEFVIIKSMEE